MRSIVALVAVAAGALVVRAGCTHQHAEHGAPVRIATFNIEDFPKDARQVDAAFALIASLEVDAIAVQEINDPDVFARAARTWMGPGWRFVHADVGAAWLPIQSGLLFDTRVYELGAVTLHDETQVEDRGKPTLEVELRPRDGGLAIRVFVVHFKSGADARPLRARQHEALARIVAAAPRGRVVVLGDFNATDDGDRRDLASLARTAGLAWATEEVRCTAFWRRDDGCPTSRLDHVLTWAPPSRIEVAGACATDGCEARDRCPLYREQVSDHCPIAVTIP